MISGSRSLNSTSVVPAKYTGFAGLIAISLLGACENNIRDVEKIASNRNGVPVDSTFGVSVLYSDSAVVKANLITPLLLQYKTAKPYQETPKGITVIFYDENQRESSRITSDFAIWKENDKLIEFRKNVVIKTPAGESYKSEELFWNQETRKVYSNKPVILTDKLGYPIYGTGMEAPENDLTKAKVFNGNGIIGVQGEKTF